MFRAYIDPGSGFNFWGFGLWGGALLGAFAAFLAAAFLIAWRFLKRHRKIIFILLAAIFVCAGIWELFMEKNSNKQQRTIILGFDGMSPEIIEPMMASGKLPNFAKLKAAGSYSRLSTANPAQSPVIWTAIATGKNPGQNGVYDFIVRNPANLKIRLAFTPAAGAAAGARVRKAPAFWNYASREGIVCAVLNYPVTFPPERIKGKMLSGMGVPDILGTEGTFSFYTTDKADLRADQGGRVFLLQGEPPFSAKIPGPFIRLKPGSSDVPFIISDIRENTLSLSIQGKSYNLSKGQWSDWANVTFNVGSFNKISGICRFFLAETQPSVRLFVTPVDLDPQKPFLDISYPKSYSRELFGLFGNYHTRGMPLDTWGVNENRLSEEAFLQEAEDIREKKEMILLHELKRQDRGIIFSYFEFPDMIQHMFWKHLGKASPYADTIFSWYERLDDLLGKVQAQLKPGDSIMLVSDHAFAAFRRAVHLNSWLRDNGYLTLKEGREKGGELLADVDWHRTKAYAISFGAIYINEKGREKYGIISPGQEKEDLKKEIAAKLEQMRDGTDKVANKVYLRQEIFRGKLSGQCPDLYLGFNPGYRASWQTALGAAPLLQIEDNLKKWGGDHLFDPGCVPGVLFINRKLRPAVNPSVYDIAPTILHLAGFSARQIKKLAFDGSTLLENK